MRVIDYSYEDFLAGIDYIAKQIEQDEYEYDYIVAIARGGCVPGVYLSHKLGKPAMMIQWNTRDRSSIGNHYPDWLPRALLADSKILLVDDMVDGGQTIIELLTAWQNQLGGKKIPLNNIRIAAMYYNIAQDIKVDYYHRTINRHADDRWVIFPWEAV